MLCSGGVSSWYLGMVRGEVRGRRKEDNLTLCLLPGAAEAGGAGCEETGGGRVMEGGEVVRGAVDGGKTEAASGTVIGVGQLGPSRDCQPAEERKH